MSFDSGGFGPAEPLRVRRGAAFGPHWLVRGMARARERLSRERAEGRDVLWWPVAAGGASAIYFNLPMEPPVVLAVGLAAPVALLAAGLRWRAGQIPVTVVLMLFAAFGFLAAKLAVERAAAPVLTYQRTVTITGTVVRTEDRGARGIRILVDVTQMEPQPREGTPRRARVTLRAETAPLPGDGIRLRARVGPPQPPVFPGTYDFARAAFFEQIGAIGFGLGPPEVVPVPEPPGWRAGLATAVERLRKTASERIRAVLPGDAGAIAAALIVGDRGSISPEADEAMRISGLSHILSISGLHMALVAGCLYGGLRALLALLPVVALTWPIKSIAAGFGLIGTAIYLIIAGMSVPTQRSFVMIAVTLAAVMLGRRAISLRSVAIAALVVIFIAPAAVLDPGAQMSFAAVIALVAGFEALAARRKPPPDRGDISPLMRGLSTATRWVGGAMLTSVIAGLATAPVALYHFHRAAPLGLIANLAAAPLVAFAIMPAGVVAAFTMPIGLEAPPLLLMGAGIDGMLAVAAAVTDWTPAGGIYGQPNALGILVIMLGGLWTCLWTGCMRLPGILVMAGGLLIAPAPPPPDLIVAGEGRRAMLLDQDGRPLLLGNPASFETGIWLTSLGDPREAADKSLTRRTRCDREACILLPSDETTPEVANARVVAALVIRPEAFADECAAADLVVTPLRAPLWCRRFATVIDRDDLEAAGTRTYRFVRLSAAEPGSAPAISLVPLARALPERVRPWHRAYGQDDDGQ